MHAFWLVLTYDLLEDRRIDDVIIKTFFNSLLYKTNRFQVAVRLFSNRSQRTSKCVKNISDTEQVFTEKRLEMCLKIHFFRLLLMWLNWGINSQYLSRRHQREKTVVIVREGSRRVVTVHFLRSEASLWVPWAMKHRKKLECLRRFKRHGKNDHHSMTKRVGSHKRNPLEVETRTTGLVG